MKNSLHLLTAGLLCSSAYSATFLTGWDSKANLGFTMTRGNSETSLITSSIALKKQVAKDEYSIGLAYSFSENEGTSTADELTGLYNWNRILSDTNYLGFKAEGRRDDIAKVDYRIQATATYGNYFVKNDISEFCLEAGPGFTAESLDSDKKNYAHIYVGERAMRKVTDNTQLFQTLSVYKDLSDFEKFNLIFTLGVETKMNDNLSLRVTLENKYESQPAAGALNNDTKLISGVSYTF